MYIACLALIRINLVGEEQRGIATHRLSRKTKHLLFMLPKTKVQKFTIHTAVCMAYVHISLVLELLLLLASSVGVNVSIQVFGVTSMLMFLAVVACLLITMACTLKLEWKIWREKRK